jgi:hypothetical protein
VDQQSCLNSINNCYWCGSYCTASKEQCPDCSSLSRVRDSTKCTNAIDKHDNACYSCSNILNDQALISQPDACVDSSSKCDLKCKDIKDGNYCFNNCIWCGSQCVEKNVGCPSCSSYNTTEATYNPNNDTCITSFEFNAEGVSKCQRCADDLLCIPATDECWVNCTKIDTETLCKSHLACTWCGNGLCTDKTDGNDYPECPACNTYTDESSCHKSIRACSWCNNACHTRSECLAPVVAAAVTIGAGIIAAIAVGAAVFVGISIFSSKKVYDAIMSAREANMNAASSNSLYEAADTGGDNPLFD